MMDRDSVPKNFHDLQLKDTDLTMFTIEKLELYKKKQLVIMSIILKRKVATELLTTFLPTILLLLITFVTIFFDRQLFGDATAVNLTIMLVMTTIFTSKIEELPPTSDMKMIDIWLIFCLIVPFLEVILRTFIECMNCGCRLCDPENSDDKKVDEEKKDSGVSSGPWLVTGDKMEPQKVYKRIISFSKAIAFLYRRSLKWHLLRRARNAFPFLNAGKKLDLDMQMSQVY